MKGLFLAGKPLPPESRHTRLYAKFQRRLAEIKAGVAKPGLEVPESGSPERPKPIVPANAAAGAGSGD